MEGQTEQRHVDLSDGTRELRSLHFKSRKAHSSALLRSPGKVAFVHAPHGAPVQPERIARRSSRSSARSIALCAIGVRTSDLRSRRCNARFVCALLRVVEGADGAHERRV